MSITNYAELKAAVISRMARSDIADTSVSEYITLAEGELNIALRNLRRMQVKTTLSLANGDSSAPLPSDYQSITTLKQQTANSFMQRVNVSELDNSYKGKPYYFDIIDKIYFAPNADAAYILDFIYVQNLPPLAVNSTNWLLTLYPHIYLNASMYQAYKAKRNTEQATNYLSLQDRDVDQLLKQDMTGSYQMRPATYP